MSIDAVVCLRLRDVALRSKAVQQEGRRELMADFLRDGIIITLSERFDRVQMSMKHSEILDLLKACAGEFLGDHDDPNGILVMTELFGDDEKIEWLELEDQSTNNLETFTYDRFVREIGNRHGFWIKARKNESGEMILCKEKAAALSFTKEEKEWSRHLADSRGAFQRGDLPMTDPAFEYYRKKFEEFGVPLHEAYLKALQKK